MYCLQCFDTVGNWLDGRKGIQSVKTEWRDTGIGCLSGARCKLFAYGSADATATSSSHASLKIQNGYAFLVLAYPSYLENGPLNGCSSS